MKRNKINLKSKNSDHLFNVSKLSNDALLDELMIKRYGEYNRNRKKRITKFGTNYSTNVRFHWFSALIHDLFQPFNIMMMGLITLDLVSYFVIEAGKNVTSDLVSAGVSSIILLLTIGVALLEAYGSYKVDNATNSLVANRFMILKKEIEDEDNIRFEELQGFLEPINIANLTVGDVILLQAGDIVPADMRVVWSENLAVDDNFVRGNVGRQKKEAKYVTCENVYDLKNIVLAQSVVTDGYALCVLVGIGKNRLSYKFAANTEKESNSYYNHSVKKLTFSVMLSALFIFPVSLISVYFSANQKGLEELVEAIMYSITIVVALVPESLPAIISFNLQHGAKHIQNENVIVKNFESVQNLGAIDIFISNKSGSITKDRPLLVNWIDFYEEKNDQVAKLAFLNAYFQNSMHYHFEQALIDFFDDREEWLEGFELIRIKQKDNVQKNGSVVLKNNGVFRQIVVTSIDQIADNLLYFNNEDGDVEELTESDLMKIRRKFHDLIIHGFRPLVVASKFIYDEDNIDFNELMYEGMVVFRDTIRENIHEVLGMFKKYNIDFKMLSGDSSDVVKQIAQEINLEKLNAVTGEELSNIPKDDLLVILKGINAFSELSPIQKALIINSYHKSKNIVAYVGDGTNDVIAIKKADVGIVPNTAPPLAKKFADIIILDKSLNNFDNAIQWGRITFLNTLKFIKLSITSNISLFFTLMLAGIFLPFFPLTATQLLIQNLVIDFANVGFMTDSVSDKSKEKTIKWKMKSTLHFVFINSFVPFFISVCNLLIICFGFGWFSDNLTNDDLLAKKIQTTFFLESFITRIVTIFVLRTEEIKLWKDVPRWKFALIVGSFSFLLFLIPYIPGLNTSLEMVAPDPLWWIVMLFLIVATIFFESVVKYIYIKIFGFWF